MIFFFRFLGLDVLENVLNISNKINECFDSNRNECYVSEVKQTSTKNLIEKVGNYNYYSHYGISKELRRQL